MTFNQYLISKKNDISRLKYKKLDNANILALILVETYYRKPLFRFIEYIYWLISGNSEVTIGLSQMKVKYIKTFNNLNIFQRAKYIISLESYISNYFLVKSYLNQNPKLDLDNDYCICKYYNGINSTEHYIRCFKDAKVYINLI